MGLFSKTKIYVESYSTPLVEEAPNLVQQSVLTSIRGERNITDDLIANTVSGLGSNLKRYYKVGANDYFYGVPTGSMKNQGASINTVKTVIESEVGEEVAMDYAIYGPADGYYFSLDYLITTRGLDESTLVVSNPPAGAVGQTTLEYAKIISSNQIEINYIDSTLVDRTEIYTYPGSILEEASYYHVRYFLLDALGDPITSVPYYWFYSPEEGTYEVLEPYEEFDSNYMPVVPLRYNNTDYTVDDESERYDTSKRLLRQLKLSISELGDAINDNPDINDIDHAYVVMGVSPATTIPAAKGYLYDFWKNKEGSQRYNKEDHTQWLDRDTEYQDSAPPPINTLSIAEAGISYNVEIGWLYIDSEIKTGSINAEAKIGDVDTEIIVRNPSSYSGYSYENSSLIIRKQIGSNSYDEIEVKGLKHINYVYGSHTVDTTLGDVVSSAADEDDFSDGMLIPLDIRIVENMRVTDRTDLCYEAMRITFNCYVKQKLKWYQTGFFQAFTAIVGIVLTIYTFGTASATMGAWLGFGTGITAAAVGAIALGVITVGIRYGIAYLVDVIGLEIAFVLAIFSAAIGFAPAGEGIGAVMLGTLQAGIQNGLQVGMDMEMRDIMNEYDALQREMDEYQEEMDEFYASTDTSWLTDPMANANTTSGLALPNETPEMYYSTRIHTGNMAPIDKAHIENYVDSMIALEGVTIHQGIKV